jgi:hypothetical protein
MILQSAATITFTIRLPVVVACSSSAFFVLRSMMRFTPNRIQNIFSDQPMGDGSAVDRYGFQRLNLWITDLILSGLFPVCEVRHRAMSGPFKGAPGRPLICGFH